MNNLKIILGIILLMFCLITGCSKEKSGTNFNLIGSTVLDSTINECSGITVFDNKIWTINDSGAGEFLLEIDENGSLKKSHEIDNSINLDWECLASDNDYLYIGDIGNNFGTRQNLKVYQLNNDLSINQVFDIVYSDQMDFSNRLLHNFDAEAMVVDRGKMWIFTKNHRNDSCNIYQKNLNENMDLIKTNSILTDALITDAFYDSGTENLYLLMYRLNGTEYICNLNIYKGLLTNNLLLSDSYLLPITEQAEALTKIDDYEFLIGTEKEGMNNGGNLYRIRIEN